MCQLKVIHNLSVYGGMRIKGYRREVTLKRIALRESRERSKEQLTRQKQVNQLIKRKISS
jgi:hypothetical protein